MLSQGGDTSSRWWPLHFLSLILRCVLSFVFPSLVCALVGHAFPCGKTCVKVSIGKIIIKIIRISLCKTFLNFQSKFSKPDISQLTSCMKVQVLKVGNISKTVLGRRNKCKVSFCTHWNTFSHFVANYFLRQVVTLIGFFSLKAFSLLMLSVATSCCSLPENSVKEDPLWGVIVYHWTMKINFII